MTACAAAEILAVCETFHVGGAPTQELHNPQEKEGHNNGANNLEGYPDVPSTTVA